MTFLIFVHTIILISHQNSEWTDNGQIYLINPFFFFF